MANEVPLNIGGKKPCLLHEFINVVLPKMSLAGLISSLEVLDRLSLAHGQQGAPLSQNADFLGELSEVGLNRLFQKLLAALARCLHHLFCGSRKMYL